MKAFPSLYVHFNKTDEMSEPRLVANSHHGMDLRDYFAAKALQALLWNPDKALDDKEDVVRAAYEYAEEMMKVREQ